jgi:hypothetical protein
MEKTSNMVIQKMWLIPSRRAAFILYLIEKHTNQAIIQYNRIEENKKTQDINKLDTLFSDCHFYFISMNKISELLYKLYDVTGFEEIANILEENKDFFKRYNEIRNHYEHIEERTSSIKKEFAKPIYYLSDFGNIENDTFTFGGKKYDISENSINKVKNIFDQIIEIVEKHRDSFPH